jgi:hypothetical protein
VHRHPEVAAAECGVPRVDRPDDVREVTENLLASSLSSAGFQSVGAALRRPARAETCSIRAIRGQAGHADADAGGSVRPCVPAPTTLTPPASAQWYRVEVPLS